MIHLTSDWQLRTQHTHTHDTRHYRQAQTTLPANAHLYTYTQHTLTLTTGKHGELRPKGTSQVLLMELIR